MKAFPIFKIGLLVLGSTVLMSACVVAADAPPTPLVEIRPDSPGPGYHWREGSWHRNHDQWEWEHGRYDRD